MTRRTNGSVGVQERERELERLYRERGDRMWRAVLVFSGDPEVASDSVAEAFAQALRRGASPSCDGIIFLEPMEPCDFAYVLIRINRHGVESS